MTERSATLRRLLDTHAWGGQTPRLRMLGFDVAIRTTDPALARHLTDLFAPMRAAGEPEHWLSLYSTVRDGRLHHLVHLDGIQVLDTASPAVALAHLLWEANRKVIEETTDLVLVHAAAVARDERAIVLTGPMGAGKSTVAAALLRDGLAYLTDEIVALDPGSGLVRPYPKPISLGGPGTPVPAALEPLRPRRPPEMETYLGEQWLVAARSVRPDAISPPTRPAVIVIPQYRPGAIASLESLRPAEALITLAEHTFHLDRDDRRILDVLATAVEGSVCARLVSGDPDGASRCLLELLADLEEGPR